MATAPPFEAEAAILGPVSDLTRRLEIFESNGVTPWLVDDERLIDGSITVDYSRSERRAFELTLDNEDFGLRYSPEELWYDKIIKVYSGVRYVDTTPTITQLVRTNLITNPSFEVNTTDWLTSSGSAIARDTTQARNGIASLRVTVPTAHGGAQWVPRIPIPVELRGTGAPYTWSVWAKQTSGSGTLKLELRGQTDASVTTETAVLDYVPLTTEWTRYSITLNINDVNTTRLWPMTLGSVAGQVYFLDSAMVEQAILLGYFDGATQDFANRDYAWTGTANASTSTETITVSTATAKSTVWDTQIGEFMIDSINEAHFPYTVKITGRDYTKKCLMSKFAYSTAFAAGTSIENTIKSIAQNAGVTKFLLPLTGFTLDRDYYFERNTERWKAMNEIATAFGFELFFDAQGYLRMREFLDPVSAPLSYVFETGAFGTITDYSKTVNDTRIFNHVVVTGESSDSTTLPVTAQALNTEPSSPTNIDRIGDRVFPYSSAFITSVEQAQDLADKYLKIVGLEEFNLDFGAIALPWLEVGEIIQFNDPREFARQPSRFLLSSLSLPLGLGAMSANGKRVSVIT